MRMLLEQTAQRLAQDAHAAAVDHADARQSGEEGAVDELLASGALTDLSSNTDDIQAQLDKVASTSQVDSELAKLKGELAAASNTPAGLPAASETVEATTTPTSPTEAAGTHADNKSNGQEVSS